VEPEETLAEAEAAISEAGLEEISAEAEAVIWEAEAAETLEVEEEEILAEVVGVTSVAEAEATSKY
jgi:hypothetical protein